MAHKYGKAYKDKSGKYISGKEAHKQGKRGKKK